MARYARCSVLALAVAALGACQTRESPPNPVPPPPAATAAPVHAMLTGTRWRLAEFQSMDDAQGTRRPADPSNYTVSFGEDGRAVLQLGCNRGSAAWRTGSAKATGGRLEFGQLAMTRAMCPPGSMGDYLAAQLPYVRSFMMRDGKLTMSLLADGGIIVWDAM